MSAGAAEEIAKPAKMKGKRTAADADFGAIRRLRTKMEAAPPRPSLESLNLGDIRQVHTLHSHIHGMVFSGDGL